MKLSFLISCDVFRSAWNLLLFTDTFFLAFSFTFVVQKISFSKLFFDRKTKNPQTECWLACAVLENGQFAERSNRPRSFPAVVSAVLSWFEMNEHQLTGMANFRRFFKINWFSFQRQPVLLQGFDLASLNLLIDHFVIYLAQIGRWLYKRCWQPAGPASFIRSAKTDGYGPFSKSNFISLSLTSFVTVFHKNALHVYRWHLARRWLLFHCSCPCPGRQGWEMSR
jgi:hypothetical protein